MKWSRESAWRAHRKDNFERPFHPKPTRLSELKPWETSVGSSNSQSEIVTKMWSSVEQDEFDIQSPLQVIHMIITPKMADCEN